jgi:hypothetical protein
VNTVTTSPSGIAVTIDGTLTPTPAVVYWVPNTTHTLSVITPQTNGGTQTTLSSWSTSASTSAISVQAQATGITYTATFNTQYQLITSASPSNEGTVSGNGIFYPANQSVTVTATPTSPYIFKGFTGDLTGTTNPQQLTMNGPKNVVATFGVAYACSTSNGNTSTVSDVQALINQALGKAPPANDINGDGVISVLDVQIVIEAVLTSVCLV